MENLIYKFIFLVFVVIFMQGVAVAKDIDSQAEIMIFQSWEEKAIQGDMDYQYNIGMSYYSGDIEQVKQDYKKARYWFEKSAKQGSSNAQYMLSSMYSLGKGVKQNHTKATHWLKQSAKQDDMQAQHALGLAYINGKAGKTDFQLAMHWLKKAATRGHAQSQYWVGLLYYEGLGVEQNLNMAKHYYEQASEQGDKEAREALKSLE